MVITVAKLTLARDVTKIDRETYQLRLVEGTAKMAFGRAAIEWLIHGEPADESGALPFDLGVDICELENFSASRLRDGDTDPVFQFLDGLPRGSVVFLELFGSFQPDSQRAGRFVWRWSINGAELISYPDPASVARMQRTSLLAQLQRSGAQVKGKG